MMELLYYLLPCVINMAFVSYLEFNQTRSISIFHADLSCRSL